MELLSCSRCGEEKSKEAFHKRSDRPRGYDYRCKQCLKKERDKLNYTPSTNGEKFCSTCQQILPYKSFFKDRRIKDGRYHCCKDCENKRKLNLLRRKPVLRVTENLRRRMRAVLEGTNKSDSTLNLIGCSPEELKEYIESLWTEGMSWDNYGDWHIDHKKPCASFNLLQEEEQRKCFHYTNLQPMWAEENLKKGSKV